MDLKHAVDYCIKIIMLENWNVIIEYIYTIRNKGLQKVLHSEAIEEPSLVPQIIFSETERSSDAEGSLDNNVLLLHREAPLF